jgi:eukaryotic-like serine/threonine-protein kinase
MPDQLDRIGQRLGNYRLIRLLGQGGFAEVYPGEHLHLKTQAAVKLLHIFWPGMVARWLAHRHRWL